MRQRDWQWDGGLEDVEYIQNLTFGVQSSESSIFKKSSFSIYVNQWQMMSIYSKHLLLKLRNFSFYKYLISKIVILYHKPSFEEFVVK